jgi:hypothetical protein
MCFRIRAPQAFPTEASALKAAKALRIDANQRTPHSEGGPGTIAELVAHYRLKELVGENQGRLIGPLSGPDLIVTVGRQLRVLWQERFDNACLKLSIW